MPGPATRILHADMMTQEPPAVEIALFQDTIGRTIKEERIRNWACHYTNTHYTRVSRDVDIVADNFVGSVANIGGAPYMFEWLFQRRAPDRHLVTIDIEPDRFTPLIDDLQLEVARGNIEDPNFAFDRKFDVIVFNELFEHCRIHIIQTMRNVQSLMAEDGRVLLSTPNGRSLNKIVRFVRGRTGPSLVDEWTKLDSIGHMGHVREYSELELREFFEYCGFDLEELQYRKRRVRRNYRGVVDAVENVLPKRFRDNLTFVLKRKASQQLA